MRAILCYVVTLLLVCVAAEARAASILKKDGTVIQGEIAGTVVLIANPIIGPAEIVEGQTIERIDETGIQLKQGAVLLSAGFPLSLAGSLVGKVTILDVIAAVMPVAAKKEAVTNDDKTLGQRAMISGDVDGPGIGSVTIPGGLAYFFKQPTGSKLKTQLLGELQSQEGTYRITPALRVVSATGLVEVLIDQIRAIDPQRRR